MAALFGGSVTKIANGAAPIMAVVHSQNFTERRRLAAIFCETRQQATLAPMNAMNGTTVVTKVCIASLQP